MQRWVEEAIEEKAPSGFRGYRVDIGDERDLFRFRSWPR